MGSGMDKDLGRIAVATPGVIVPLSATDLWVESFMIQPDAANTGRIFLGDSTLNRGTKTGVRAYLPIPTENISVAYSRKGKYSRSFNLKEFYIDAEVAGEGIYLSANIA